MSDFEEEQKKVEQEYLVYINSRKEIKYDFDDDLIEKLASIVAEDGLTKVNENEIAQELKLSPNSFSNYKGRNSLPYQEIIDLCLRKNVNINWVLYSKQPLWKQEKATRAIQYYYECRTNKYKKLYNKFTGICKGFVRFVTVHTTYSCLGDCKDLPTTEIKYFKEDDIFGPDIKKSRNLGFLIFWFTIFIVAIYYFGYNKGAASKSIPAYEKEIEVLKKENLECKKLLK